MSSRINPPSLTGIKRDDSIQFKLKRLKKACADFESLFIYEILKCMRSAIKEEGIFGHTYEKGIIYSMFDENLSMVVSQGEGIGIGNILYERLKMAYNISE